MTNWPLIHLLEARMYFHRRKYNYDHQKLLEYQAKVENNKRHFPSHHDALHKAEAGVKKWGPLVGSEAKEIHKYADKIAKLRPRPTGPQGEGYGTPKTAWNPYRRPIANWITREIYDAHDNHGTRGTVTSGLRTYQKQKELYELYQRGGNIAAYPGQSNHEGWNYSNPAASGGKSGAVDFEPAESLDAGLKRKSGHKLIWAYAVGFHDHPHFSRTGH